MAELVTKLRGGPRMRGGAAGATPTKAMLVAGVAALVAGGAVLTVLDQSATGVGSSGLGEVKVLVAGTTITRGATAESLVESGAIRVQRVPGDEVEEGALREVGDIQGKVATGEVLAGEQLVAADFKSGGDGASSRLSAHQRAMTLSLDQQHGLVGTVRTGDRVDVYGAYEVRQDGQAESRSVVKVLARDVPVLDAPDEDAVTGRTTSSAQVTVRVDDKLVPQLAYTAEYGKVWVVLRPAAGGKDSAPAPTTIDQILFGTKPQVVNKQLKPKGEQ